MHRIAYLRLEISTQHWINCKSNKEILHSVTNVAMESMQLDHYYDPPQG